MIEWMVMMGWMVDDRVDDGMGDWINRGLGGERFFEKKNG